jgi:hypothetical protein
MRFSAFVAAALLVARVPAAHAVPLEFSATSFTWGPLAPDGWQVTAETSIELVDLADPNPGVGRFRLDASGSVVPFSSADQVQFVRFSDFLVFPGTGFLGVSLLSSAGLLHTAALVSPGRVSMTHDLVDVGSGEALPALPPVMEWTASWEIALDASALGELDFWSGNAFASCVELASDVHCDGGTLSTGGFSIQVSQAPIPEPGTAALLATGLIALVWLRRQRSGGSAAEVDR